MKARAGSVALLAARPRGAGITELVGVRFWRLGLVAPALSVGESPRRAGAKSRSKPRIVSDLWTVVSASSNDASERMRWTRKRSPTFKVKVGLAEMLKGGVIMDVVNAEQAKIAEDAGPRR